MSRIIAAIFDDSATADGAMEQLRASGFAPDAVDSFALNAPGQHHGLPMGGDKDADVGATGAGHGALTGAAVGSVVGAAAGIAAATLLGPVAIAGGLAAGAYAGSLAGAVGTMGDDKPAAAPTKEERPAGIMVAAAVRADQDEDAAVGLLRNAGARMLEWAHGEWRDGHWVDFDPVVPPTRVEFPPPQQRVPDVRA